MVKNNKALEAKPGDTSRTSKRKVSSQQSAPLESAVSLPETAKKPKVVAAEAFVLSVSSPAVAKGTSAANVAEEEWKMPALPKYAAVPIAVFRAGGVEVQGTAADKMELIVEEADNEDEEKEEEKKEKKEEDGADNDSASGNEKEEESGDEGNEYNPDGSSGDRTVNLADDIDNVPDEVKPSQKENVSSPFDLPILPIVKTMLVKQGKKGKQGKKLPDGDGDNILLLGDEEDPPLTKKKKVSATKSSPAGSSSKVGTSTSSEDALLMIKG
jgi:hypothetical protein